MHSVLVHLDQVLESQQYCLGNHAQVFFSLILVSAGVYVLLTPLEMLSMIHPYNCAGLHPLRVDFQ